MQYGSIGWSVGATLGYAQAARYKRAIACIGDGSFQVNMYAYICVHCIHMVLIFSMYIFVILISEGFFSFSYLLLTLLYTQSEVELKKFYAYVVLKS